MTTLRLQPVNLTLAHSSPEDQRRFRHGLRDLFDEYGFALLTGVPTKLVAATNLLKQSALPVFQDEAWAEVMRTWPRLKHGQLGPTGEGEEVHLDAKTREARDISELKRYVSVDARGDGWGYDDEVRKQIPLVFQARYQIALKLALAYEEARAAKPGTLSGKLSIAPETHTTGRVQWYPAKGFSLDHTDKCAITVIDFEEGLEIEHPKKSDQYQALEGAKPGDLAVNIGDITSRIFDGEFALSTRHRASVPASCGEHGRIVFPTFFHTSREAVFPNGENIWQWCVDEWAKEGAATDRAATNT